MASALTLMFSLTACGKKDTADMPSQEVSSSKSTEDISAQESTPVQQQSVGSLTVVTDNLGEEAEQTETLRGGTNQNDAVLLPLNTRMTGKATQEGGLWYAFTTGSAENATYKITTVNKTLGTGDLNLRVYDAYGETIHDPYSPLSANKTAEPQPLAWICRPILPITFIFGPTMETASSIP